MSDRFSIIPFRQLVQIVLHQIDTNKSFFGIPDELFFKPKTNDAFRLDHIGQNIESPIGVAAGPHTQLAQNIVAAWLCGARFIELKTVQTLDELEVSKPCIDMQDEGYNCEWSQELKIEQSFNQYLEAWIIIHILKDKLKLGDQADLGTIFNMSVGYDYKGILNENVQWFFNKMTDASRELNEKIHEIKDIYPNVVNLAINPRLSNNVTLSTMHGCPPEEIEQIGAYLITEKKLHTAIKLNPTLLGKKDLQEIITNSGFETMVPDVAFEHDLKYDDALKLIRKLQQKAVENKVFFGLKLTNTLESLNHKDVFPEKEKMMYASGNVLHPISINLAKKLQNDFAGKLNISFSGGADAFNTPSIVASGLFPVTVCSDILKPGGYGKLHQYIENLRKDNVTISLQKNETNNQIFLENLNKYATAVLTDDQYKKIGIQDKSIKTNRALNSFDCIHAPCVDTCATSQGIPDYLYHAAHGNFDEAFDVIMKTNPFPNTTGMVCDHLCQSKCTRINYDSPVLIRDIKRFVTENATNTKTNPLHVEKENRSHLFKTKKVGIIGAGPAGLSCANFLRLAGFEVNVYEEKQKPGGMVMSAIPSFRLKDASIMEDIKRIEDLGVRIHYSTKITKKLFEALKDENDYIFMAMGAQKAKAANLEGDDSDGVLNPLDFLFQVKQNSHKKIGDHVIILGAGNTAMDAARTAKRLISKNGSVKVVYRRTKKQMPADFDEIIAVQEEGIEIMELVSPLEINTIDGKVASLTCINMALGDKDATGRARPIPIKNSEFELQADTIIPAFGQDTLIDFVEADLLKPKQDSFETQIPNVFIGGDAMRGGSTIINAVGDGRKVAGEISIKAQFDSNEYEMYQKDVSKRDLLIRKTNRVYSEVDSHQMGLGETSFKVSSVSLTKEQAIKEASRCVYCDVICNVCTSVCPNLALFPFEVTPVKYLIQKIRNESNHIKIVNDDTFEITQEPQILVIADWCNECGNCNTFCPTEGAPYKDKPHLYMDYEAFLLDEGLSYYYQMTEEDKIYFKSDDQIVSLTKEKEAYIYRVNKHIISLDAKTLKVINHNIQENDDIVVDLKTAAEMVLVLQGAKQII